jgi:hypothetical protein
MLSRKWKYEDENRGFKTEWEEEFVFVERNGKPMSLLCQITLSQFKASNLKHHYDTHHSAFGQQFPAGSMLRRTTVLSLKEKLYSQSKVMSMFAKEANVITEAGFILAFNIARAKRPYTEGELIKKNIAQVISVLYPENKTLHKMIEQMPASRHTVERRISVISADIVNNLQHDLTNCSAHSPALDESTDIEDTAPLPIFVCFVTND